MAKRLAGETWETRGQVWPQNNDQMQHKDNHQLIRIQFLEHTQTSIHRVSWITFTYAREVEPKGIIIITPKWTVTVNTLLTWLCSYGNRELFIYLFIYSTCCLNSVELICLKWELGSWKRISNAVQEAIFPFEGHELFLVLNGISRMNSCPNVWEDVGENEVVLLYSFT